MFDAAAIIEPVARILLGEPNKRLSKKPGELRFGSHGSLAVDLKAGRFYDHEAKEGGGLLDLIERQTGRKGRERVEWLIENGFEPESARSGNGTAKRGLGNPIAVYDYVDETGALLFQVCRFEPKTFRQRRPDPEIPGRRLWSVPKDVRRVPYRLPDLIEALSTEKMIVVVEGEKDVNALWHVGISATCNAGGAGKWSTDLNGHFAGADVVTVADHDEAGRNHAADVARNLTGIASRVRVLDLGNVWPQCPTKGDISDYLKSHSREQLDALLEQAGPPPKPTTLVPHMILSSAEFVAGFVPPDYVMNGVLQRRFLYALTGKTGSGKTAIMLLLAAHIDMTRPIGDREVEKGKVLYLAGENADDVRMRWIAMAQQLGFELDESGVFFIPGAFKISETLDRVRAEIERIGEVALIIVDTRAAFFEGDAENDNVQFGNHARLLRKLIDMPGLPCVIVACHPIKNADDGNLLPRGGGAFLNEIDGNLTARTDAGSVEVSTQGKFRGPDFTPLHFQLRTVTHERLKDSKGRLIPTVVASPLSERGREDIARVARSKEDDLLIALLDPANCRKSHTELARHLGWTMSDGQPYRVMVSRMLKNLQKEKLLKIDRRGVISLTKEGQKEGEQACSGRNSKKYN
jgi:5S rRNA maturation endonuclease (ribonuclease M5)